MPLVSPTVDTFLTTSAAIFLPSWVLLHIRNRPSKRTSGPTPHTRPPYERFLTFLVHLHTLYILYVLTAHWPPNVFTRLNLPLSTPAPRIREVLIERAGLKITDALPKPLESLLSKLGSVEVRMAFVRFGQGVVQDCTHCKTLDQYALFAIPRPLLQYIREAALIGLLTTEGNWRARWRLPSMIILVAAGLAEAYTAATVPVSIPRDGNVTMWHDNLFLGRHTVFLFLPIIVLLLPRKAIPPPVGKFIAETSRRLMNVTRRVTFMKFLNWSMVREPRLREASSIWWEKQKTRGEWAKEDEAVWRAAELFIKTETRKEGETSEQLLRRKAQDVAQDLLRAGFADPLTSAF